MLEAQVDDNSQLFTHGGLGNPCCRLVNATNTDLQEHKLHLKSVLPQEGDLKCKCRSHYVKQNQSPSYAKLCITGINLLLKLLKLYPACSALIGRVMLRFGLPREKHCLCSLVLAKNKEGLGEQSRHKGE